jgi:Magnesium chelatase, subunit ChlI
VRAVLLADSPQGLRVLGSVWNSIWLRGLKRESDALQKGNAAMRMRLPGDAMHACRSTPAGIERYRQRISGPLLDRIDIRIAVPRLGADQLLPGIVERDVGERQAEADPPAQVQAARARRLTAAQVLRVAAGFRAAATAQLPAARAIRSRCTWAAGTGSHDRRSCGQRADRAAAPGRGDPVAPARCRSGSAITAPATPCSRRPA